MGCCWHNTTATSHTASVTTRMQIISSLAEEDLKDVSMSSVSVRMTDVPSTLARFDSAFRYFQPLSPDDSSKRLVRS